MFIFYVYLTRGLIQALLVLNLLLDQLHPLHLLQQSNHHQICQQLKQLKMMRVIELHYLLLSTKEVQSLPVSVKHPSNSMLPAVKGLRKVTDDQKTHKNPALRGSSKVEAKAIEKKSTTAPKAASTAVKKAPVCELQGKKWIVVSTLRI